MPLNIPRRIASIVVDTHMDRDYGWDTKEHSLGLRTLQARFIALEHDAGLQPTMNIFVAMDEVTASVHVRARLPSQALKTARVSGGWTSTSHRKSLLFPSD